MNDTPSLASGKDHTKENFPVASWLLRPDARGPIMAYYRFARAADDIADHPTAAPEEKLRLLAQMRAGLAGEGAPEAQALARECHARGITLAHAQDLLSAFEQDCHQRTRADWDDLMAYCRYSAMPVGRFVLDVHGEDRQCWPMNDALCAALQIINHMQDCGKDFRALRRIYLPADLLAEAGVPEQALAAERSTPALLGVIREVAMRTQGLLRTSAAFADTIRDRRLALEVAVIQRLAEDLCAMLLTRDPLADPVHHSRSRAAVLAMGAILRQLARRAMA